jgi:hypothetical protein
VYSEDPDFSIRIRTGHMSGTTPLKSWTVQLKTQKKEWQWTFVWRPNVTKYFWAKKKICEKTTEEVKG